METTTEVTLIQLLNLGRSALQQKFILHLTLMPIADEPGAPDKLWRLQLQTDTRLKRLQREVTRMMKDVGNTPLMEPSENAQQKA